MLKGEKLVGHLVLTRVPRRQGTAKMTSKLGQEVTLPLGERM